MAERAFSVKQQEVVDPESGESYTVLDRDHITELVDDVVSTMLRMGGMASLAVRRVQAGEAAGRPTFETTEFIVIYNTSAPSEQAPSDAEPES